MSRFIVVSACAAAIVAGTSLGYFFGGDARARQEMILSYVPPELPENISMQGVVVSTDTEASAIIFEAVSPHAPQEHLVLRVRTAKETSFARVVPAGAPPDSAAPSAQAPDLSDLRPGMLVRLEVKRAPGALEAVTVLALE